MYEGCTRKLVAATSTPSIEASRGPTGPRFGLPDRARGQPAWVRVPSAEHCRQNAFGSSSRRLTACSYSPTSLNGLAGSASARARARTPRRPAEHLGDARRHAKLDMERRRDAAARCMRSRTSARESRRPSAGSSRRGCVPPAVRRILARNIVPRATAARWETAMRIAGGSGPAVTESAASSLDTAVESRTTRLTPGPSTPEPMTR